MNALVTPLPRSTGTSIMAGRDMEAMRNAMKSSLYPGATDASVDMVLSYCAARNLDPMTKPVHIVPMWVAEKRDANNRVVSPAGMRDVVMPGIGTYRIDAHRTGEYAGQDEVEFGPTESRTFQDGNNSVTVEFPTWARVTVYRLVQGIRVAFSAKAIWLESYSTAGRSTKAPNAMWQKRAFSQLEKCAEALALRKGFPEAVGSNPTAEEMEDKHFIDAEVLSSTSTSASSSDVRQIGGDGGVQMPKAKPAAQAKPAEQAKGDAIDSTATREAPARAKAAEAATDADAGAGEAATGIDLADGPKRTLLVKAKQAGLTTEEAILAKFPSVNMGNLNVVLGELRKMQDANDGAA